MKDQTGPVLVTGAMGQVGKLLVEVLLGRGNTVIAVDLPTEATRSTARTLQAGARRGVLRPEFVDITDPAAVREVVGKHQPAAVVHLAAIVSPPCYRNPQRARRVNVDGTQNLVDASTALDDAPSFILASSAGVYGARNPYRNRQRITPRTPANPVDCYGEDKIAAEELVQRGGLPHAVLRLAGVVSPDPPSGPDYLVLMRAIPRDSRVHMVDARDVALAFANAVERIALVDGKTLLIGGDESYLHTHTSVQDDMFSAIGLGRFGPGINLPGNPDDDRGWSFTDWFDTSESQDLLDYQHHHWSDTLAWVREAHPRRRLAVQVASPLLRPLIRTASRVQRRRDQRGAFADPWTLIAQIYGEHVLAPTPPATASSVLGGN